jgi:hypothetical protein
MHTNAIPHTVGSTLASVATGLVVGCIALAFALAIGVGIGIPFALFGKAGLIMAFVLTCLCICFVSEALGAAAVAWFSNTHPAAFAMAIGFVPICPYLVLTLAEPVWAASIKSSCLLIGLFQGLGGLAGCRRARSRAAKSKHGIGTTCADCTYDLTATAQGKPCPECGGMMRISPECVTAPSSSNSAGAS